jgi:predicted PurR-regulated permease PerM
MLTKFIETPLVRTISLFVFIVGCAAAVAFLIQPVLFPFLLSFVLYGLLDPLCNLITRRGLPRTLAIVIALICVIVVGGAIGAILIPRLIEQFALLQTQLPNLWEALSRLSQLLEKLMAEYGLQINAATLTRPVVTWASSWGKTALVASSNTLVSLTSNSLLIPIFTFFLLRDYRTFRNTVLASLPNSRFELGWLIYARVGRQLQSYVAGLMLQSTIMACVTSLGFALVGLDNPMLLGFLAGVLNLIPYVGPVLAMIPPVVIVLGHGAVAPWMILSGVLVIVVGQLIDNVLVIPVVLAQSVALHPLTLIVGIIVFGNFMGLMGMVVAVPILSTANILFSGLRQGLRYSTAPSI